MSVRNFPYEHYHSSDLLCLLCQIQSVDKNSYNRYNGQKMKR